LSIPERRGTISDDANRYRHLDVSGSHFEIGQQIGEYLKEELRGFVETSWDRIAQTLKLRRETS
jgi:hypothetical protein